MKKIQIDEQSITLGIASGALNLYSLGCKTEMIKYFDWNLRTKKWEACSTRPR